MAAPPPKKTTIIVNQKTFHVDQDTLGPAEIRALVNAPDNYEVWKVLKGPDPEGQLPADDIQVTAPIALHNGDKFRVVPQGTFGARR